MNQIEVEITWLDIMEDGIYSASLRVYAASGNSSATQECICAPEEMKEVGDSMVRHSFEPNKAREFLIDTEGYNVPPMKIILHEANWRGLLPIEMVFQLEDRKIGVYSSTVIVWVELGQLERFGKRFAVLPSKGQGAVCKLID